jgi:uncharacterized membrane protein SpoIIM required for sporulation
LNSGRTLASPTFSWILNQAYWRWRKSPALNVPVMIRLAVTTTAQTLALIPFVLLLIRALRAELVAEIIASIGRGDPSTIFRILVERGAFGTIVEAALLSLAVYLTAQTIGSAFTLAAEYGAYHKAATSGTASIGDAITAGFHLWSPMFRTYLLHEAIVALPIMPSIIYLGLRAPPAGEAGAWTPELLGVVYAFVLALLLGLIISATLRVLFIYTYPTLAVEGRSGISALARSARTVVRFPHYAIGYTVTRIVGYILLAILTLVFSFFGPTPATIITLGATLLIDPVLHITKTLIFMATQNYEYLQEHNTPSISGDLSTGLPRDLWFRIKLGLGRLLHYVRDAHNIPYHTLSIILFATGVLWGWQQSSTLKTLLQALGIDPSPGRGMAISFAPSPILSLDIFLHNWQVALTTALAGLGFGVPTTLALIINGAIVGAVGSILPPHLALMGLTPHGIIEVPAFLLSGSVGLQLASRIFRTLYTRGGDYTAIATGVADAIYLLLGLAPLFFAAGIIETFVTPILLKEALAALLTSKP